MTREARSMSGIILITVPTIQYGGYFLLTSLIGQGERLRGESAAPEFLSCRACPCGRDRDSVAGLPNTRGCGSSSYPHALVRSNRSAAFRDSHFGGFLLLGAASIHHSSQRSGRPDLCRGADSRGWRGHTWHRLAQDSASCVDRGRMPLSIRRQWSRSSAACSLDVG